MEENIPPEALSPPKEDEQPAEEAPQTEKLSADSERLQQLALSLNTAMPTRSLPKQEYIQETVVPLLLEGISWIIKERPEDPVESLAMFLIKNNPMSPELHRIVDPAEFE
ncbi:Dpy-30 motif family protein [Trichomonas vaginalis G3]|uniref:Dpy-30 motif family protein n=1 Tax=Trichomonas vaginalis (strain ATCC PRA-98 / G3) TaxID=412133 RepID=A2DF05_TRIV3|nr:Dpy-30 motif-containing protein [Trichomonas vaginalis G3]EAY20997.1 Dpy-30 motif family protein [Trichomonas vaginalis G3]KAI5519168.1 Dpy-30 motif-containing protein [Trichomonas vaginalis G3]|eukprot:XP_001581983.1 Dpy-30 motif family protein [Trichomonas vaginalis G3]